jgi:2,4-diketo-3-deoxy-L-fuconate hydrolase
MRLMRLGDFGAERPYVQDDDGSVWELGSLTDEIDGRFLASDGIARVRQALDDGALVAAGDVSALRIGAPVATPMAVVNIGMNYAAHAAESGAQPPAHPVVFFKHPNTVVGPNDDVVVPLGAEKLDWEVELSIVIGKRARYLGSVEESKEYIAGFTIANDVSERDFQITRSGGQWSIGKSAETFNPLGPWLVPADDLQLPARLVSRVNGEPRQDSSTADLIFGVDYIVWYLSQHMVLEPGDIVNTGTPEGVALSGRFPYLVAGDVLTLEIEGLGVQTQRIVGAQP